ncbi:16S rRNA (guanine(527)-N(7))-methyltransferase RsmG [bacterium]|nr:MAG: 16S rRNA (guanine(527)-N(7))-methyltransferase RsmG [bacterium]
MSRWNLLLERMPELDTARLDGFTEELLRWNKAIRLVGPGDIEGVALQITDSLLPLLVAPPAFPLLDIGSGAGLPAIPLAIAHPGEEICCLEPRAKRVSFLRHAARLLGLASVKVVEGRADPARPPLPEMAGAFRCATARAVSDIPTLLGWAFPCLAPGGEVLLGRGGGEAPPEVRGWRITRLLEYRGAESLGKRYVVGYSRQP